MQFIPGAQGLFPYQDAGRNEYEGFGNAMAAIAGPLMQYKLMKDSRRTLGDIIPPAPQRVENPGYFQQPSMREMTGPGTGPAALQYLSGSAPRATAPTMPMTMPGTPTPLQDKVYGGGLQNIRLSDLSALHGLIGDDPNKRIYEYLRNQYLMKRIEAQPKDDTVPIIDEETGKEVGKTKKGSIKVGKKGGKGGGRGGGSSKDPELALDRERRQYILKQEGAYKNKNADLIQKMTNPGTGWFSSRAGTQEIKQYYGGLAKIRKDAEAEFNRNVKAGKWKTVSRATDEIDPLDPMGIMSDAPPDSE